jgi:hypothetical protein
VRAAHAVEAIAAEVCQQCECSGQLVTMSVINRVLNQLSSHLVGVLVWALRGRSADEAPAGAGGPADVAAADRRAQDRPVQEEATTRTTLPTNRGSMTRTNRPTHNNLSKWPHRR